MKTIIIIGLCTLLLMSLVSAQTKDVSMKTNEIYTAYFKAENIHETTLINCIPHLDGNLETNWTYIKPRIFDIPIGESQDIILTFEYPPEGYYEGCMQITCERYYQEEFVGTYDILNPSTNPCYQLIVKLAGAGQSYTIYPSKEWNFISKPSTTKSAKFTIANLGTTNLPIRFEKPSEIDIQPPITTIPIDSTQIFTITITTTPDFKNYTANIRIYIGDYLDHFTIKGETESLKTTGAAIQSIAITGNTNIAGLNIPTPIIIIAIIISLYFILKEKPQRKKKRDR